MEIYLYGGGGHAKVILDILHRQQRPVAGIADDCVTSALSDLYGVPVCSTTDLLARIAQRDSCEGIAWIIAIGNNQIRQSIAEKLSRQGYQFTTAIHPSAQIALGVAIAPGTVVMANAVLNTDVQVGHHAIINTAATIDHDCVIGDYVHIGPGCSLCGQVVVAAGALLGVGTKVKPAIEIGAWTTCGAGSIVVKSLPPHVVAYGCPARAAQT
jgi:sugar O-acyltransferase (sialic acid O-acetyltransferase NeuD family)